MGVWTCGGEDGAEAEKDWGFLKMDADHELACALPVRAIEWLGRVGDCACTETEKIKVPHNAQDTLVLVLEPGIMASEG